MDVSTEAMEVSVELLDLPLGALVLGDLEHVETNGLGERAALACKE